MTTNAKKQFGRSVINRFLRAFVASFMAITTTFIPLGIPFDTETIGVISVLSILTALLLAGDKAARSYKWFSQLKT
jgi:hypothetical protein